MKKRIAVFANGWGNEYLHEITNGVLKCAQKQNSDVFTFVDFSIFSNRFGENDGEMNVFHLPNIADFDGVILLTNSFNVQHEMDYLQEQVKTNGIPTVSLEYRMEGIPTVLSDNYSGMYELAEHMVAEHKAQKILVIAGPEAHQESQERVRAVVDVCKKYTVDLPEENILHGDWAQNSAKNLVDGWLEQKGYLPDVIISANDVMAIGICDLLQEKGYEVPEDVCVTGYDHLLSGQEYFPSLASVSHEWQKMGETAYGLLEKLWNGEKCEETIRLNSRFIVGGSCGCRTTESEEEIRIGRRKKAQMKKMDGFRTDSHFRHIYAAISKSDDIDSLRHGLNYLFSKDHWMEGDDLMICLEKEFFHIEEGDGNLRSFGYGEEMQMICCLQKGEVQAQRTVNTKESIFYLSNQAENGGLYIFVPICSDGKTYGYAMMSRDMNIVEDNFLYIWTRHMNQNMEQVRRNIKIADLTRKLQLMSITDTLTGVYNRCGCEEYAYPMLQAVHDRNEFGLVLIADIDRMKTINDFYGHMNGDLSLKIVSKVLRNVVPEGWAVSRFGGDEFLIAGELGELNPDELVQRIHSETAEEAKNRKVEFFLSLSIGYTVVRPDDPFDMREIIQRADQAMYWEKKDHHAKIDGE